ncbi:MAG: metal-dependent hydrolase [Actinobacteria bacterium]|nr:metal-dependent hydrolase [Actinomycetota bacterium]
MAPTSGFSVTSWNLLHAMAIPPNSGANLDAALKSIHDVVPSDVFAIQEVDVHQDRSGNGNQVRHVAESIGAAHWAFAPVMYGTPGAKWRGINESIIFENNDTVPQESMYGIGIVSKIPVKKWHRINLGKAPLGMPLLVAGEKRPRFIYVSDEPRCALVAELENGISITTTHLSFVPMKNALQLKKITNWIEKLSGVHIFTGDFNLPWGLGPRIAGWNDLIKGPTYPSWKPSIEFDYIMSKDVKRRQPFEQYSLYAH